MKLSFFYIFSFVFFSFLFHPLLFLSTPTLASSSSSEESLSFFLENIFQILIWSSVSVGGLVFIYGAFLHFFSANNPEKKKRAKEWMLGAFHGTLIVLLSHLILITIDSHFLLFDQKDLATVEDEKQEIALEWQSKEHYFQVPFGLLLENASVNETARDKIYDILDAIYDAEDTADAIIWGGQDLLDIIDFCPIEAPCCDDYKFCDWPEIPFTSLQRAKEDRKDFFCYWDKHNIKSSSPTSVTKPSLRKPPIGRFDFPMDVNIKKEELKPIIRDLNNLIEEFFPQELKKSDPLWGGKEYLLMTVRKMEALAKEQKSMLAFMDEIRKIANEIYMATEYFPFLKEEPFFKKISSLAIEWEEENPFAKGDRGQEKIPFVEQFAIDWRHIRYNYGTLGHSGCLLASTVMALHHYGVETDILEAMDFAVKNGYAGLHGGTSDPFAGHFISHKGMGYNQVKNPGGNHLPFLINWLENEGPVIVMGRQPPWSSGGGGHALVLSSVNREKEFFYMNNTSAPFMHTTTFAEVLSNMPEHIVYLEDAKKTHTFLQKKEKRETESHVLSSGSGGCINCPEISCAIMEKIEDINIYIKKHDLDLWSAYFLKNILQEDLYHLYKSVLLKDLGMNSIIDYPSFLFDKIYYDKKDKIILETDIDFTEIYKLNDVKNETYVWDWERWINNIAYKNDVVIDGHCISLEKNDPLTFYFPTTDSNKLIRDAFFSLAFLKKQKGLQYINPKDVQSLSEKNLKQNLAEMKNKFFENFFSATVFASINTNEVEKCLLESGKDINELSIEEIQKLLIDCGIQMQKQQDLSLRCGNEIPVGEAFEITWDHFQKILFAIDGYAAEGALLLELQKIMNEMAMMCSCICGDPCCDCDPPFCGGCQLTCDKEEIFNFYYEKIIPQREKMKEIARYITHLTKGFFNHPTENICNPLNEDVRSEEENLSCNNNQLIFITKHELITRKVNYSRSQFNKCYTPVSEIEGSLLGEKLIGKLVFGGIAERDSLPRYTKTKLGDKYVNTSNFNWFCCYEDI